MIRIGNFDSIDLDFSWDGDFILGNDGDVKDTRDDLLRSFINELHTIARSEFNDWQEHPNLGANMSEFRGEPNTREVGEAMQNRLVSRLVAASLVQPEDVEVRVVPVGRHQVLCVISVSATATSGNRLTIGQPVVVTLVYDSLEDSVFFLEESQTSRNAMPT